MIRLTGADLTIEDVVRASREPRPAVELADDARRAVQRSRAYIEDLLEANETIYGVTTGFGRLAEVFISPDRRGELQVNLVRSHSSGVGRPLPPAAVRAIMLLRANALARGHSGCRVEVVERLIQLLGAGITPVVPEAGSAGASGDLAPLAHVALALIGEGRVEVDGEVVPTARALSDAGIEPLRLVEKEGLALVNGTQATTALGILAWDRAARALETAEVSGAMSLEGLRGSPEPFRDLVHQVRPHPGQVESARRLWALMEGSEIRESHREDDPRVQDAYSLRCMPQVHGATRNALDYVRGVLATEINSATDNPLIFPEQGRVISAGNFHAQIVAQALDLLVIAITDLAAISERRVERLLNPDLSRLPAFLADDPGVESGLMIGQVTAVDLLAEMRVLSHPASVDSVPTSAAQEDHVSMGMTAARKALRATECLEYVLAIELLCAARALEFTELRPGRGVAAAVEIVRERVAPMEGDRTLSPDIEALRDRVRDGAFARIHEGTSQD